MADPTRGFEMPFSPTPPSQANGVNGHVHAQRSRRVQADAADVAARVARARRREAFVQSAELVELRKRLHPDDAVTERFPSAPELSDGCGECGHGQGVHTRGKGDDISHCRVRDCGCPNYVDPDALPLSVLAWGSLAVALVLAAVVFAVLGQYGVAFLVIAGAAIAGGLAWIHDAPMTRGGR